MFTRSWLILYAALFLVTLVIYHSWIVSFGILSHGDWRFLYPETQHYFYHYAFSLWNSLTTFGRVTVELGQAPTFFLYGFFAKLFGTDFAINERIIYFWPIAFITPFASCILLSRLFRSLIAIFIGVLTYSINTYFLVIQTGHLTLMVAYALAPLVLFTYIQALEQKKAIWAVLCGLLFYLCSMYEPRAAYIIAGVLGLYAIYSFFLIERSYTPKRILLYTWLAGVPFLLTLLLNLYWIIPLANIGAIASNELFTRTIYGNEFFSINNSLTLFHPFWTGYALEIATSQPILWYFWLMTIFAILGLFVRRNNAHVLFFALIALIGIFLTKQSDIPFPYVYPWLYENFPGFNAFREASKFYFLTALGYSVLVTGFFSWFWDLKFRDTWKVYGRYGMTVLIVAVLLWNTRPLITGDIGTLFVERMPPEDFLIVRNFLLKQPEYFRTLWIPVTSRWSTQTREHPMISMGTTVDTEWNHMLSENAVPTEQENNIIAALNHESISELLNDSAIKYVIVSTRVKNNEEDWVGSENNREMYITEIQKVPYLRRIDIGTKDIAVYENPTYSNHISLSNTESVGTYTENVIVTSRFVTPTEYAVDIDHVKEPFLLEFSETYHPDWQVRVGDFTWDKVLQERNYSLPPAHQSRTDAGFNAYHIDPQSVCSQYSCQRNSDGTYKIFLTLFFRPQAYLKFGFLISGVTVFFIIGYLVYYGGKKIVTKK